MNTITITENCQHRITQADAYLVIKQINFEHQLELGRLSKGFLEAEAILKAQLKAKDEEIAICKKRYDAMRTKARELEKLTKKAWYLHNRDIQ